uniref:Uncharacterized protein n=1 Tax=Meloidogyne floridensis TaxID=298350 RepID=A0A915P6A4_9BILA
MNSTKIFIQMLLMFIPFSYVLASFENQGVDPYKGFVADEKQLANDKEFLIKKMKKLGIGNDSGKNKKSVKGETSSGCWQLSSKSMKKKEKAKKSTATNVSEDVNFQPEWPHTEEFNFQPETESLYNGKIFKFSYPVHLLASLLNYKNVRNSAGLPKLGLTKIRATGDVVPRI